jgi:DNA-directed RNA polymerase specialized sigma24 family protein
MPDVSELAERALEGDRASFDALFDRLFTPIAAYAHGHAGSREQAERWIEDTFLELIDSFGVDEPGLFARAFAIVRRRANRPSRSSPRAVRAGSSEARSSRGS